MGAKAERADPQTWPGGARLAVLRAGEVARTVAVGPRGLRLGRGPSNDLILTESKVSGHHALLEWRDGALVLVDLRSTNGTTLDGERISERALRPGQGFELGGMAAFRVEATSAGSLAGPLLVHDLDADVLRPVRAQVAALDGEQPDPARPVLSVGGDGGLWVDDRERGFEVTLDQPFEAGGRRWAIRPARDPLAPTDAREQRHHPFTVRASLASGEPEVQLEHHQSDARHRVRSANRASLLYVLARATAAARQAGEDPELAGWVDDEQLRLGIWGARCRSQGANNLQVLIHRTRVELGRAGFDGWCIEKRRGGARLVAAVVECEG